MSAVTVPYHPHDAAKMLHAHMEASIAPANAPQVSFPPPCATRLCLISMPNYDKKTGAQDRPDEGQSVMHVQGIARTLQLLFESNVSVLTTSLGRIRFCNLVCWRRSLWQLLVRMVRWKGPAGGLELGWG